MDLPASLSYTDLCQIVIPTIISYFSWSKNPWEWPPALLCGELKAILAATLGEFEVIPRGPIYYLVCASPFPYSVYWPVVVDHSTSLQWLVWYYCICFTLPCHGLHLEWGRECFQETKEAHSMGKGPTCTLQVLIQEDWLRWSQGIYIFYHWNSLTSNWMPRNGLVSSIAPSSLQCSQLILEQPREHRRSTRSSNLVKLPSTSPWVHSPSVQQA